MSDRLTSTLIPSESFYTGHSSTNSDKFDIRDYLDRLEKSKKAKNKYVCPVCNGSNLAVSPKTGQYYCFSGDCTPRDIREAIAPWADSPRNRKKQKDHFSKKPIRRVKVRSQQKAIAPIPDNDGLALATFTPTDSPKVTQKPDRVVTVYQYGENFWVERSDYTDPKKDKITIPYYQSANGAIKGKGEEPWPMYRESEAIAHGLGKFVGMAEGEKCVESLRSVGLVGATFQGGSWTDFDIESGILRLKAAGVAGIAYLPDNDDPGFKKAEKIKSACAKVGMPYVGILPETLGISDINKGDVFDAIQRWIHAGMSAEQIRETLEKIFRESAEKARSVEQQMIDAIQDADDDDDWTIEDIRYFLGSLADENMPESLVKLNIASLSRESGYAVNTLTQIFASICKEKELETVADDVKAEITSLLDSQTSSVDIGKILPKTLADPILKLAGWMNLRPEAYLMSLLATASSLPQNGTNLNACVATNYRVSPNLFVAIVAESSQKKSPILKAIATEPLERLHKDECEKFNRALKDFKNLQKQTDNPDDLPPEPQKKVFFVTNTTGEAILRQAGRQSSGILYLTDELKALFGNLNAYRSGKGSDEENLLEYYDGTGGKVLRVDGLRDDVSSLNLGVIGGIQPEVLERLIDGKGDTNGKWARFIFVHQPLAAATLPINGGSIDISDRLAGIYQKIAALPALEFRWSSAALKRFAEVYDKLEQLRIKEPNQALRSVIGKTAGRIAKIALNLHIIRWAASEERSIETEIGIESLTAAITLAKFAIQQIKSLYVSFDSDSPAPHLVKILNFAQRKGTWVKAREVAQSFKNMKTDMIRQYFLDLEKAGMGEVRGTGKAIEFLAFGENVGSFVGGVVGNKPTPETLTEQAFGEFVGNVGNVGKISEIQQPQQPQQPEQPQQPQQPQQPEDKKATMINEIECLEPSLDRHYGSISLITIIESRYRRSTLDALTLEQLADLRNHVHQLNSPKKQASSLDLRS